MGHVVVIGAGPAGTSCAIQLLKAGIKVTLVERTFFPRNVPGETVHPGIQPILEKLGIFDKVNETAFIRHKGIISQCKGEKSFEPYNEIEQWLGFQLFRKTFDKILLDKAISLGAQFFVSSTIRMNMNNDHIQNIIVSNGEISADFFIDATGKSSFLNRELKIGYKYDSQKLIAYYGYAIDKKCSHGDFEHPKIIWDNKGWTWISRVKEDLICWNRLTSLNEKLPLNWVPEELKEHEFLSNRRAVDVTWRIANNVSKNNYFLVGDAAFVLDPASSHGVIKAIMSGIMVGDLITKISSSSIFQNIAHEYYNNWLNEWYKKDVEKLKGLYLEKGLNICELL